MPRLVTPLSNTKINKAKPKSREYNLADGQGLYLRIKPNGNKSWIFNYQRPITQRRANLTIGRYPELSLKKAREARSKYRELLAEGIDPKHHKTQEVLSIRADLESSFEKVFYEWFEIHRKRVSRGYAIDIENSIKRYVFPAFGNTPIKELRARIVIDSLKPIAARGNLETIKRLCQRINLVMVYALNTGYLESNPLAGIREAFESPKRKNLPSLSPAELPELLQQLNFANIRKVTRCLIEWQLHTIVRPGEAAGAKWCEIDFEEKLWRIPPERMKRNREHIVPLSNQALGILDFLKPISGHREFIFPSDRNPKESMNSQSANAALKRMGFKDRTVSHGLRALASTTLNEQGFDSHVVEMALAHVDENATRAAYNRADYLKQRREMMDWWSSHIAEAAQGSLSISVNNK